MDIKQVVEDGGSVADGIRLAVSESAHLKLSDAPTIRAVLTIAEEIDDALPQARYEILRNLGGSLLKYLEALGFTASGRKALGLAEPASGESKPTENALEKMQKAVPGLRAVQ